MDKAIDSDIAEGKFGSAVADAEFDSGVAEARFSSGIAEIMIVLVTLPDVGKLVFARH